MRSEISATFRLEVVGDKARDYSWRVQWLEGMQIIASGREWFEDEAWLAAIAWVRQHDSLLRQLYVRRSEW